jgi:hypothetical protein
MKYCLAIAFIFFVIFKSVGQPARLVSHDTYTYRGDLVKIIPSRAGGYGYSIYSKSRLVARESLNPFSLAPEGLSSKSDVLKLACWQIDQTGRAPHTRAIINQRFPRDLAATLRISAR